MGATPSLLLRMEQDKLLKGGVTQWWDSWWIGRIIWHMCWGTTLAVQAVCARPTHPTISVELPHGHQTPSSSWSDAEKLQETEVFLQGQIALWSHFFPVLIFIRQMSLHCLAEENLSMGIHHIPNLEQFLTSWKKQNKQHLICKLLILDSIPRGGGKPRR